MLKHLRLGYSTSYGLVNPNTRPLSSVCLERSALGIGSFSLILLYKGIYIFEKSQGRRGYNRKQYHYSCAKMQPSLFINNKW